MAGPDATPPRGVGSAAPSVAAVLSFVVPGLGQAWLGAGRRGLVFAIPALAVVLVVAALATFSWQTVLGLVVRPESLLAILVLNVLFTVYHAAAVADAFRLGVQRTAARPLRWTLSVPLAILLVVTVAFHGAIELVGFKAYDTVATVVVDPSEGWAIPSASFEPTASAGATPRPEATPPPATPTPEPVPAWAVDGRLNLLLIGGDAGPRRWSLRTDTMVLLSIDVDSGRAALFGFPRNLLNVPLPPESAGAFPNGRFPEYLNGLYVYAMGHPTQFPGGDARGFRAVSGAIQEMAGVPLDGAIVVTLNGFTDLVNAIGGLWIDVPYAVYDDHYPDPDGTGPKVIYIEPGCQRMGGERALAYARSRHMDSDYGRMERQQIVLQALARQVDPLALVAKVPELLDIARDNLFMTITPDEVPDLAELAARVDTSDVEKVLFFPPTYAEYVLKSTVRKMREAVRTVFDVEPAPSGEPTPQPDKTPKPCPRD